MVEYWNHGRLGKEPGSPRKGPGFRGLKPIIPIFQHSGFKDYVRTAENVQMLGVI